MKKKGLQVKTVAKVYTFGENSWTMIPGDLQCVPDSWNKFGQFASGNLHWLTTTVIDQGKVVLSMDVENETCGQLLLPPHLSARDDV
ncbi:hypothetical protein, partial [Bradyrhizobium sp. TM233]|uniref:hypothetical protein n=1 Tax=Bradyrhizobium sp. TM233 TaxID=2599801 RepID=UPI0030C66033